jgi:hypothetical protein
MSAFWQGVLLGAAAMAGAALVIIRAMLLYAAKCVKHDVEEVTSGRFCGNCKHFLRDSRAKLLGSEGGQSWCRFDPMRLKSVEFDDEACEQGFAERWT